MAAIGLVALVVREYDEAIDFYVRRAGFTLAEDTDQGAGRRWVVLRPPSSRTGSSTASSVSTSTGTGLLLARATDERQRARVGDQFGGRVGLFLTTDDFAADHARMSAAGVHFVEPPRHEPYGTVAVFEDLYGNRWDLIQPS